ETSGVSSARSSSPSKNAGRGKNSTLPLSSDSPAALRISSANGPHQSEMSMLCRTFMTRTIVEATLRRKNRHCMNLEKFPLALEGRYQRLESADFVALWTGFLFVRGSEAGEASVARILHPLRQEPPERVFAHAKGSFALCVFDKNNR